MNGTHHVFHSSSNKNSFVIVHLLRLDGPFARHDMSRLGVRTAASDGSTERAKCYRTIDRFGLVVYGALLAGMARWIVKSGALQARKYHRHPQCVCHIFLFKLDVIYLVWLIIKFGWAGKKQPWPLALILSEQTSDDKRRPGLGGVGCGRLYYCNCNLACSPTIFYFGFISVEYRPCPSVIRLQTMRQTPELHSLTLEHVCRIDW